MTIKELQKKFGAAIMAKKERSAEIDDLKKQLKEKEADKLEAADRGDLESYEKLEEEQRKLNAKIFVYSRNLSRVADSVTVEEVESAWKAFTKDYDRDMKAKYDSFVKDCEKIRDKYSDLVKAQEAALIERKKAVEMIGKKSEGTVLSMYMLPIQPVNDPVRGFISFPEIAFLYSMGLISIDEAETGIGVLEGRTG